MTSENFTDKNICIISVSLLPGKSANLNFVYSAISRQDFVTN